MTRVKVAPKTAKEKARTKKKRQAAMAKAQASPNSNVNLHRRGKTRDDYDNSKTGRVEKQVERKRMRRVAKGEFDVVDWDNVDQRLYRCKEVKRIVARLLKEANIDSYSKQILAERCAFIIVLIRNEETMALKGGDFNQRKYVSLVGKLQGILTTLGLEKTKAKEAGLTAHLAKKSKNGKPK